MVLPKFASGQGALSAVLRRSLCVGLLGSSCIAFAVAQDAVPPSPELQNGSARPASDKADANSQPSRPAPDLQDANGVSTRPTAPQSQATPQVAGQPTASSPVAARNQYDGRIYFQKDRLGSAYIPVDSWMYPALLRLYSLGYLDTAYISMRPWTRRSVLHMLQQTEANVRDEGNKEANDLLDSLENALDDEPDIAAGTRRRGLLYGVEQAYAGFRQTGGPTIRDSWHLGQTFVNDYGRPYSTGFNSYDGIGALAEAGPFSLYVRGEYQHAPSYTGYNFAQAEYLSRVIDQIPYTGYNRPQLTLPEGVLPSHNNFRILEANASVHVYGHEVSFGKSDAWLGPGTGGAMAWSNNAENMYTFRINRVEPLHIPFWSRIFGDARYDFFIGSLKGHTYPNSPWAHSEMFSTKIYRDFEVTVQRTIIFGGKDHAPVTLHTFLKGFFSSGGVTNDEKYSRDDPGARFSSLTFNWRLPWMRNLVTLYTDSETHDDVFPLAAPRRAGWRPGIYLARLPYATKFDLRAEGTYTDYVTTRSIGGQGNYYETIQRQGYTNKGFLMGDWIGREGKGGNVTVGYHMSPSEWINFTYMRKKNGKDFMPLGSTQNDFKVEVVKRIRPEVELSAWYQHETWKAPFVRPGQQTNDTGSLQVKWYPRLHSSTGAF